MFMNAHMSNTAQISKSSAELATARAPRAVRWWLVICMCMVACMVLVGGLTRLTESGLSMVEWKPLHILPPMNVEQWQEEFSKYQTSPEYLKKNHGMSLSEFKGIFWLEYLHRLLGRSVGVVFFLPWLFFVWRGMLTGALRWKTLGIFALGGLQGLIGWVMVKSGLQNNPWVSPVKLAMHLSMAFLIFNLLLWQWLNVRPITPQRNFLHRVYCKRWVVFIIALLACQIVMGAFVAGMDAGLAYDTFPTMNGQWIPDGLLSIQPWWHNVVENPTMLQFNHRLGAYILTVLILLVWSMMNSHHKKHAFGLTFTWIPVIFALQFGLGVATVIWHVPIVLASAHQMVALALLAVWVALLHRLS